MCSILLDIYHVSRFTVMSHHKSAWIGGELASYSSQVGLTRWAAMASYVCTIWQLVSKQAQLSVLIWHHPSSWDCTGCGTLVRPITSNSQTHVSHFLHSYNLSMWTAYWMSPFLEYGHKKWSYDKSTMIIPFLQMGNGNEKALTNTKRGTACL